MLTLFLNPETLVISKMMGMVVVVERGVAIFAKDFSGLLLLEKSAKNYATANAFGCPDRSCFTRLTPNNGCFA
jgi:hypothetical protein